MNETILKDLIATAIIVIYVALLAFNMAINPALGTLAMGAIGFLFKPGANGGWTLTNPFKKVVPVIVGLFLLCSASTAKADIFAPIGGPAKPYKAFLGAVNGTTNADTILTDAATIINFLGVVEGESYQFNQHKFVTTTGATIVTYAPWNLALQIAMLNADGVTGNIAWNVGNYLAVDNIPILTLTQYLYVTGGVGAEQDPAHNEAMKLATTAGLEFKFSF